MKRALRSNDPVIMLEHRELLSTRGPVPEDDYEIAFGRAAVVRQGQDLTVVALARMVHLVLSLTDQLAAEGISVEVIDPRTVSPLDTETICQSVARTGRLLVIDEAYGPCGIGAEIAAAVAENGFNDLDAPIRRINGCFAPTPYSPTLESSVVPQADDLYRAMVDMIAE
jgi:2-oxoisovalerate dehydrogenase E1 component